MDSSTVCGDGPNQPNRPVGSKDKNLLLSHVGRPTSKASQKVGLQLGLGVSLNANAPNSLARTSPECLGIQHFNLAYLIYPFINKTENE